MDDFRTLISAASLQQRIRELALEIGASYPDEPPCTVAVIEGARTFASHLTRHLDPWRTVHEIRARSYGDGTVSSGSVQIVGGDDIEAAGRQVLLVEDIVDTGRTVAKLREHFLARGATDFAVATLLTKPARRVVDVELAFVGFEIPDEFVIGFGMDLDGRYRELDRIAIYDEEVAAAAGE